MVAPSENKKEDEPVRIELSHELKMQDYLNYDIEEILNYPFFKLPKRLYALNID